MHAIGFGSAGDIGEGEQKKNSIVPDCWRCTISGCSN